MRLGAFSTIRLLKSAAKKPPSRSKIKCSSNLFTSKTTITINSRRIRLNFADNS